MVFSLSNSARLLSTYAQTLSFRVPANHNRAAEFRQEHQPPTGQRVDYFGMAESF